MNLQYKPGNMGCHVNTYRNESLRIWLEEPAINFIDGTPDAPGEVNPSGHLGEKSDWITALPIGNGRLGGLIFGGINDELIKLNEETLWSGEPKETNNMEWSEYLPQVRKLIAEGRYEEADKIAKRMQGPFNESYLPFGNLRLHFKHGTAVNEYCRELLLDDAIVKVSYNHGDLKYTREYFCSRPDNIMVIRISCSTPGSITFDATLNSMLLHKVLPCKNNGIILKGKAPNHVEPNYMGDIPDAVIYDDSKGMTFEAHLKANADGGRLWADRSGLHIEDANSALLILALATSYNGFDKSPSKDGRNAAEICTETLLAAGKKGYDELIASHMQDFHKLFDRVELHLNSAGNSSLPTKQRLANLQKDKDDPSLYSLFFNFGRYLLISCSRPGNLPANLQGIWSDEVRPPWSSNWTLNINAQMNYWPAEVCNLSECHEVFIDYIDRLRINGRKTAKAYYGASGWAAASNGDIWNATNPVGSNNGNPSWANWVMSGPWLCQHIWLHYEYTLDRDYLDKTAYPIMKECAQFLLEALVEDKDGYLGISPGTSPERTFLTEDKQMAAVSFGTTMDNALIREIFSNVISASQILGIDTQFACRLNNVLEKLLPYKVGRYGQLQEWSKDWDDPELKDSHCSFLYGLYPGWQITPERTPDLAAASRISLDFRDYVQQGWGLAWRIGLWARLYEAGNSFKALKLLVTKLTTPCLLGKIYPDGIFQIDANLGGTAGIAEMLLQSHEGFINILPALPGEWSEGFVKGLKAKGGFTVDIEWMQGRPTQVFIRSEHNNICRIKDSYNIKVICTNGILSCVSYRDGLLEFHAEPDKIYLLRRLEVTIGNDSISVGQIPRHGFFYTA